MTELHDTKAQHYKDTFDLECFVETGCYRGDGIKTAIDMGFDPVISCDINQSWLAHCASRFVSDAYRNRFSLHAGASHVALPPMCREAEGPTLFFLDAHLPEMYGMASPSSLEVMPVLAELAAIRQNKAEFEHDVIICDDMRIIKSDDNPRWRPGETICCEPVEGLSIQMLRSVFNQTHDVVLDPHAEGMLIFTPK